MKSLKAWVYWSRLGRWWRKGGGKFVGFDSSGDRMYTISNGEAVIILTVCGIMAVAAIAAICYGVWRLVR